MEEIKVGEYVRTKDGKIGKIYNYSCGTYKTKMFGASSGEIAKHSPKLIDLIEEGDFVNGFPVMEPVYNGNVWWGVDEGYEQFKRAFGEIKSIVTKEQFAQIEYKVEE